MADGARQVPVRPLGVPAPPRPSPIRPFARWAAPGVAGLLAAAAGQQSAAAAYLSLLLAGVLVFTIPVAAVLIPLRLFQKRPVLPPAIGLVLALAAFDASAHVIFGVPAWVRRRAAPAISALETWREQRGRYPDGSPSDQEFPPEIVATVRSIDCAYRGQAPTYSLTCRGVLFTRCTYDAATRRWRAWR